jgi:hypothetical protein
MTVTIQNMKDWLGLSTAVISDVMLTECLDIANDYCAGYCTAMGVGASGQAYDSAVRYKAAMNIWRNLDIRGINVQSFRAGELGIGHDVEQACEMFHKLSTDALHMVYKTNAPSKRDLYMRHLRSGRGMR